MKKITQIMNIFVLILLMVSQVAAAQSTTFSNEKIQEISDNSDNFSINKLIEKNLDKKDMNEVRELIQEKIKEKNFEEVKEKIVEKIETGKKAKVLLILDEPTDGFSSEQLDKIRELLEQIRIKQIILVSHEPKLESYVDNIIRVHKEEHVSRIIS